MAVEPPSQRHRLIGAVLLALLAAGCTEIENPVNTDIGTTRLITVDSGLAPQSVSDPQTPIQVAEWTIEVAELEYSGLDEPLDLTIGSPCETVQTVYEFPITEGRCERGIVIDSAAAGPREVLLRVAFTMQVRRAEPVVLPPAGDHDHDARPRLQLLLPDAVRDPREDHRDQRPARRA